MKTSVSFQQGKQNQDIDERFIQNGEYRELINARVLDSDTENAGCITSLSGTEALFNELLIADYQYRPIAITSFEDLLYVFFAHETLGNVIMEYNTLSKVRKTVFIDGNIDRYYNDSLITYLHGHTNGLTIKHTKLTKITPQSDVTMHVFEGMLFFHDREDEPFKINIQKARSNDLLYYTTREDITVAKMPPQSPQFGYIHAGGTNVQNFNSGEYKFAARYEYDDGEISAISPLSTMPVKVLADAEVSNVPSKSGEIVVDNAALTNTTEILSQTIPSGYSVEFIVTHTEISTLSDFSIIIKDRKGNNVHGVSSANVLGLAHFMPFDNNDVSSNVAHWNLYSSVEAQRYPVIMSASASRTRNDDVIAFVTNTRQGKDGINQSRLFIYYVGQKKGYYTGLNSTALPGTPGTNRDYQSVHVTCDGEVYVSYRSSKQYALAKFDKDLKQLVEVIGSTSDIDDDKRIAKPHTIASDYSGNIVYYVHTRDAGKAVNLFQSVNGGDKSSFKLIANDDVMFADHLSYIAEYGGKRQNRLNVSCCCSADGMIVYVGNCNCIARSDDAGQTWQSYIIDENNVGKDTGSVIDLKCSADGKFVYAVVGVGDNAIYNQLSVDSLTGEVEDGNFPAYTGNLYASMSYGRDFRLVELNTSTFYGNEPANARVRSIACNDSGDTVIADGFAWSYEKKDGESTCSLTDFPNTHQYVFQTLSTFMSSDYGINMYATSLKQWIYNPNALGAINDYTYNPACYHGFNEQIDLSSLFLAMGADNPTSYYTHNSILIAHTLNVNDIKMTKIENDVAGLTVRVPVVSNNIEKVHMLLYHNGKHYTIDIIDKSKFSGGFASADFTNAGVYSLVSSKDANKLYDNVPLKANASDIAQNALIFGGYTDGYDSFDVSGIKVAVKSVEAATGDIGLKSNADYSYGIIAYDKYNRSSSVMKLQSLKVEDLQDGKKYISSITFPEDFKFPQWVSHFKFCRTKLTNNYYLINGFDGAMVYGNKILLDITSNTNIVPKIGDTLEVIYDYTSQTNPHITFQIIGYIDNKSGVYSGDIEKQEIVVGENKRLIVIANNTYQGYDKRAVILNDSKFASSLFYLNSDISSDITDVVYYEIPYTFKVNNRMPSEEFDVNKSNIYDADTYTYTLHEDGDVIMYLNPTRELNILNNNIRFTTLGRVSLATENAKQMYRSSSICVSEPFVQDTGFNGLSSFSTSLANFKDLDNVYGAIEAVDGLDDNIAVYQKYRCSQVQYKKNVLTTADGNAFVSGTQDIFGEQQLYALEYGLTDHHSLVKWGNTRFFVDQKRGAVLRIDYNGIHNISDNGMRNYFYKCLSNYTDKIMACYDVSHSSYMLFHIVNGEMICDNYFTPVQGWSAKFEIAPVLIVNTRNGVFSFKGFTLYKHDVLDYPYVYGNLKDIKLRIPCNEHPEVIKNFNAIQIDSTSKPVSAKFITRTGESTLQSNDFEKVETEYQCYIPMIGSMSTSNPVFCCVAENNIQANKARLKIASNIDLHTGDICFATVANMDGTYDMVGDTYTITSVGVDTIDIEGNINILKGAMVFAVDASQTNGFAHKGTSMMIELKFTGNTVVKSITADINESKI